ncbi:adenosine deaminase [Halalkalicoccus salilacus]
MSQATRIVVGTIAISVVLSAVLVAMYAVGFA